MCQAHPAEKARKCRELSLYPWWQPQLGLRVLEKGRGAWRDLSGCCLHQTGFWDKQRACQLTVIQKLEKGNPQTQAQNSKAVRKKAHSCFIQTELVVAWAQRDGRNDPEVRISTCQLGLSLCKSHKAEGIPARCRGAAFLAQLPKHLPGFLSMLCSGDMTLHILRLSAKPGISCCATSGSLTQHGDDNKKSHLLLGEKVETTSPERDKGLSRVCQAF